MFFKRGHRQEMLNFEKCLNEERRYQKLAYTRAASVIVSRTLKGKHNDVKIAAVSKGQYFGPNYFHNSNEKSGKPSIFMSLWGKMP